LLRAGAQSNHHSAIWYAIIEVTGAPSGSVLSDSRDAAFRFRKGVFHCGYQAGNTPFALGIGRGNPRLIFQCRFRSAIPHADIRHSAGWRAAHHCF
jgi:hypothetical protein